MWNHLCLRTMLVSHVFFTICLQFLVKDNVHSVPEWPSKHFLLPYLGIWSSCRDCCRGAGAEWERFSSLPIAGAWGQDPCYWPFLSVWVQQWSMRRDSGTIGIENGEGRSHGQCSSKKECSLLPSSHRWQIGKTPFCCCLVLNRISDLESKQTLQNPTTNPKVLRSL